MKKLILCLLIFMSSPLAFNAASLTCSYNDVVSNLTNFYNTLENKSTFLLNTNMFLCTGMSVTCDTSSVYTNIGLLNSSEYQAIGGLNSFLSSTTNYWTMTENGSSAYQIKYTGLELIDKTSVSGLKPVVYINTVVEANGNGSFNSPFIFIEPY